MFIHLWINTRYITVFLRLAVGCVKNQKLGPAKNIQGLVSIVKGGGVEDGGGHLTAISALSCFFLLHSGFQFT